MKLISQLSSVLLVSLVAATAARGADLPVIRLSAQAVDDPYGDSASDVLSHRGVSVDAAALRQAAVGARFVVPLTDGIEVTAIVQNLEIVSDTMFSAYGRLDDHEFSSFVIVGEGDALVGSFRSFDQGVFSLRLTSDGAQVLRHRVADPGMVCGLGSQGSSQGLSQSPLQSTIPGVSPGSSGQQSWLAIGSQDTGAFVDVLIGYTPIASILVAADGYPSNLSHAVTATNDMNMRLSNSELIYDLPFLRRVAVVLLNQNETGSTGSDLNNLANSSDGLWDGLHAQRAYYGADLVHVFAGVLSSGLGGLANRPSTSGQLTIAKSYGITRADQIDFGTFAHEVGHNFGCHHHQTDSDAGCPTCPPAGADTVIQPWAFGYRNSVPGLGWFTTMAYSVSGYTRVPYYSNPFVQAFVTPAGGGVPTMVPMGTATNNNSRLIEETALELAKYAPSVTFVGPGSANPMGTESDPYPTLGLGLIVSVPGHEIKLLDDSDFTGAITQHVQLSAPAAGPIIIGQ